ncbi:MAG: hypothetical protein WA857_01725 [Candidatus Acidiferrum sp.]
MNKLLRSLGLCLLLSAVPVQARDKADRVVLFPKLSVGQIIRYRIGYRSSTTADTESTVAAPMAPTGGQTDANILLEVEVEDLRTDAGIPLLRLRTRIVEPALAAPKNPPPNPGSVENAANSGKTVELTLHGDGRVTDIEGLDKLTADERAAWQEWVARFGGAATFPEKGVKPGEKWKTDEPISNAALAGLSWEKESQYVNDAPCAAMSLSPQGDPVAPPQPQDTCAVILTTAILKQKSSPKNATPEDYKLHDLRNMGVATGKNQVISYFSLKTGLIVRATEDANQSMSVIVATSDGSNRVHYTIAAESHARVLLLASAPANPQ